MKTQSLILVVLALVSARAASAQSLADAEASAPAPTLPSVDPLSFEPASALVPIAHALPPFDRLRTGMTPDEVRFLVGRERFGSSDGSTRILAYEISTGSVGEKLPQRRIMCLTFTDESLSGAKLVDAEAFTSALKTTTQRVVRKSSTASAK